MSLSHTPWAAALLLISTTFASAEDWPQWLGPQRDAVWRETGILTKFPEGGPKVRWRVPVNAGYAGPAVADGRVFIMDRVVAEGAKNPPEGFSRLKNAIPGTERVLCFRETDGELLWKHEYDCPYTISYPLGPRCTPTVHEGKVYTLGTEGHLFCLDADTGKPLWERVLTKEFNTLPPLWGYSSHVLIDGQKLISMVGGEGSAVVAFDRDTGKEIWRSLTADNIAYCPPMIFDFAGKRQLIIWHGEAVNSLDPETGKPYWQEQFITYQSMAISTPRMVGDYMFFTSTFGKSIMMKLDSEQPTAKLAWTGNPRKNSFDSVFSSPFAMGDYFYGSSSNGELVCIKAATGERMWVSDKPNGRKNRSADIFLIKNGDRFFLWTEKGDLIIAQLSPEGYKEIDRANIIGPTSGAFGRDVLWCHPAFANKSMFVKNDKELVCVSLAGE